MGVWGGVGVACLPACVREFVCLCLCLCGVCVGGGGCVRACVREFVCLCLCGVCVSACVCASA